MVTHLHCGLKQGVKALFFRADLHDATLAHATSLRQAYDDVTYDCRSVLKHVLKCYDIFSDVHDNRKRVVACRKLVACNKSRTVRGPIYTVRFFFSFCSICVHK